jgi:23S rRNA (cytidine1920-2'-O)/16S rRNA (cytidine1409-2'-O)-methyltransferase
VTVDGHPVTNPRSMVLSDAAVRWVAPTDLQGRRKLSWAIDHFGVDPGGRVALDVGACTGGFTTALLEAGAARVYAVDAGHGQLLGSLRQDPRVVNLERTNVGALGPVLLPEPIDVVTVDVSYLSLSAAVAQLTESATLAEDADLLGLVKPMFELRLPTVPTDPAVLDEARVRARDGVERSGWEVVGADECPVRGHKGAVEFVLHARRRRATG